MLVSTRKFFKMISIHGVHFLRQLLIPLILVGLVFKVNTLSGQIILHGKIKNYDGVSKVFYSPTLEGITTAYAASKTSLPSPSGAFEIAYQNKGIGTLRVNYKGFTYSFIHTDTTSLELILEESGHPVDKRQSENGSHPQMNHMLKIGGDYSAINELYNSLPRASIRTFTVQGSELSQSIAKIDSRDRIEGIIDSMVHREFRQLDSVLSKESHENKLSSSRIGDLSRYFKNQGRSFYLSIFLNAMMLKRNEQIRSIRDNSASVNTIYNGRWEEFIDAELAKSLDSLDLSPSNFEGYELLLNLHYTANNYRKYDFKQDNSTDSMITDRLGNPYFGKWDARVKNDHRTIFLFKLEFLFYFLQTPMFYSSELMGYFNQINSAEGPSIHLTSLDPSVDELRKFLRSKPFDKAFYLDQTSDFVEALEPLKTKNILIDVWATWCSPCIQDFSYKNVIKPFIDSEDLVVLYISIDKMSVRKKWKEVINFYQLRGYHIQADDKFQRQMWGYIKGNEGAIPRYILVKKGGSVFAAEAARPSQGDELIGQINKMLDR